MGAIYDDLRDRHVLVTGGANGIGAAIVEAFVEQGARVSILDRDAEAGRRLVDRLHTEPATRGGEARLYPADLTDEPALVRAVEQAVSALGDVDVLVNNAGWDPRYDLQRMTAEQWDDLFALNVRHYFLTCRQVLPAMIRRRAGSIIMTASLQVWVGAGRLACYTATKAAIIGLVRSLAREVGPHRIRVNAVAPGWVMTGRQLRDRVTDEAKHKLTSEWQCLPFLLEPRHLAPAYLFLASDASAAITRQTLLVDAGYAMT